MILRFHKTSEVVTLEEVALDATEIATIIYGLFPELELSCDFLSCTEKFLPAGDWPFKHEDRFGKDVYPEHPVAFNREWTPELFEKFLTEFIEKVDGNHLDLQSTARVFIFDEIEKSTESLTEGLDILVLEVLTWLTAGGYAEIFRQIEVIQNE